MLRLRNVHVNESGRLEGVTKSLKDRVLLKTAMVPGPVAMNRREVLDRLDNVRPDAQPRGGQCRRVFILGLALYRSP